MKNDSWIKGKTCLITGANTGIGKETARQIADLGAKVVMVCRNQEKGKKARQEIIQTTKNENVELLLCDLASLSDVKRFSEEFLTNHSTLHVLINNAGVFNMKRTITNDGYEGTFAVNYLAHFYLTRLLLPLLKKNSSSRIINLSSDIHKYYKIKLKDPMLEKKYNGQQAYSNSKTAMILFTYKLVRELEESEVTVNAVNPGHVETQMTTVGLPKWFTKIRDLILKHQTPEEGARTSVYVASSDDLRDVSGKYFYNCEERKSGKITNDIAKQDFLWELSEQLIEKVIEKEN
ncbi:MAG: SDR family oxidoreductase [Candidatus Heimdallarchaeota archaeon]|nr:SDR family oxidoreductase [Candidatus Heimdallarchaeota archaeon]MCK4877543.1 SDR family oxidoreductase [Candidatus Heimdallarchaeota archaeon]